MVRPSEGHNTAGSRAGLAARARKGLAAGSWVAIQNCTLAKRGRPFVAIQGSQELRYGHDAPRYGAGGCDTRGTGHACTQRYDRVGPVTRPVLGHYTAPLHTMIRHSVRCLGVVRAACARRLGSGCALGAPNPVLTQCTVLSHCLDHYS